MSTTVFELDIESDIEPLAFSRILATIVNGSQVFLAKVIVGGTVVYPTAVGSLFDPFTVRTCRFAVRNGQTTLSPEEVQLLAARIANRFAWSAIRTIDAPGTAARLAS